VVRKAARSVFFFISIILFFAVGLFFVRGGQPVSAMVTVVSGSHHNEQQADKGEVTAVYDGDTIRVRLDSGRSEIVRLIGINAPEIEDKREQIRFFAFMSKRFAFNYLYRKRVRLVYDWERRDKYDRVLAFVFTDEGLFNEFILREGFASVFLKYPFREDFRKRLKSADAEARESGRGFWQSEPYPVIPAEDARDCIGKLLCVRFRCREVRRTDRFVYLRAGIGDFSVVVEKKRLAGFPEADSYRGKWIKVTGFVEKYRGRPEVFVSMPQQLEIEGN
jgi:micrococcal nuclease